MESFLPTNAAGAYGEKVDGLLNLVTYIVTPWTILAFGLILLFCFIYRRRQDESGQYVDSHETLFTIGNIPIPRTAVVEVPTLMVLGLDLWIFFSSVAAWGDLKIKQPEPDTKIQVVGKQFGWDFYYAGENGKLDTTVEREIKRAVRNGRDLEQRNVTVNPGDDEKSAGLVVQSGDTVGLKITSKDVIHSLFIPNLRFKQDAVPGRNIDGWLRAQKPTRPTYLERQITSELKNAISVAEKQFSGEPVKQMKSALASVQSAFDIEDQVPDYASVESDVQSFADATKQLEGEGTDQIKTHLKNTRSLFAKIQSNEHPYFKKDAYTIGCAELCGTGHSGMVSKLIVLPEGVMEDTYNKLVKGEITYGLYFVE